QLLVANTLGTRVKLFEFPLQDAVNMGALQHVYHHGRPAYSLGNDWGGTVNSVFDRFFLSGIPKIGTWAGDPLAGGGSWDFPVPNTRLVPYRWVDPVAGTSLPSTADLQDADSAQYLLVRGSFNINSTSITAWRSVLGGLNIRDDSTQYSFDPQSRDWQYAVGTQQLESAVFRFPHTGHLLQTAYRADFGLQGSPSDSYLQGVRELTEDQIYALAYEIVYQLRHRQNPEPFFTLREFVNSGIIQTAIDNCDFQTPSPGNPVVPFTN